MIILEVEVIKVEKTNLVRYSDVRSELLMPST